MLNRWARDIFVAVLGSLHDSPGDFGVWRVENHSGEARRFAGVQPKKRAAAAVPCGPKSREETPNEGRPDIGFSLRCNKYLGAMLLCTKRM